MSKSIASALVGFTVAFLGVLIVAYLATSQWMAPFAPVRVVTLAVLLPVVAFGVLITMPGEGEEWTPGRIIAGAGPGTVFGIIGMVIASSWASPSVRISAVGAFSEDKSKLVLALDDRSPEVSAAACAALLDIGPGGFRGQLMDAARERPDMAAQCLEASVEMERGPDFARQLMGGWENDLLQGKAVGDACELPDAVAAMPVAQIDRERALLACFFESQNKEMRKCCSANLGALVGTGQVFVDNLATRSTMLVESNLLKDVASVGFGTVRLDEKLQAEALKLGLGSEATQPTLFRLVCEGVLQMDQPSEVTKHLAASLDGRCEMNTTAIPRGRQAWEVICEQTQTMLSEHPDFVVTEALCLGVEGLASNRAVSVAQGLVGSAVEGKRKFGNMERDIEKGFVMAGDPSDNDRKVKLEQFMNSMRNDPNMSPQARQILEGMDAGAIQHMAADPISDVLKYTQPRKDELGVGEDQMKALENARERVKQLQKR